MSIFLIAVSTVSGAREPPIPGDVANFIQRRDVCDHFRGEPYEGDPERRRFVEQQSNRYCTGTDRELAALRRKYSANPAVLDRLSGYETCIEAASNCRE